jgi:hypothetical protein
MIIYIAGANTRQLRTLIRKAYILESFAYIKKHSSDLSLLMQNNILLDSGAFTFIGKSKKKIDTKNLDWEGYITEYANFINKHKIDLFIELDIYSVVGLERTEALRGRLEMITEKQAIPVWHRYLGTD